MDNIINLARFSAVTCRTLSALSLFWCSVGLPRVWLPRSCAARYGARTSTTSWSPGSWSPLLDIVVALGGAVLDLGAPSG
jgi:hypothetical protein